MIDLRVLKSVMSMIIAAMLCGVMVEALEELYSAMFNLDTFVSVLFQTIFAGFGGILVYIVVMWLWKNNEAMELLKIASNKLYRRAGWTEGGEEAIDNP